MTETDLEGLPIEDGERFVFSVRQLWELHELERAVREQMGLEPEEESP